MTDSAESVMSGVAGFGLAKEAADDDGWACCELEDETAADDGEDRAGALGKEDVAEEAGGFDAAETDVDDAELEGAAEDGGNGFVAVDGSDAALVVWETAVFDADEEIDG